MRARCPPGPRPGPRPRTYLFLRSIFFSRSLEPPRAAELRSARHHRRTAASRAAPAAARAPHMLPQRRGTAQPGGLELPAAAAPAVPGSPSRRGGPGLQRPSGGGRKGRAGGAGGGCVRRRWRPQDGRREPELPPGTGEPRGPSWGKTRTSRGPRPVRA